MTESKKLPKNENSSEKSKKEKLEKILEDLRTTGGVIGSAIISKDGLAIVSDLGEQDVETFAAMSAAMQGAAETAVSELNQGSLNQIIIDSEKGKIMTMSAGDEAILVVLTKPKQNTGLILIGLKKAGEKITDIL